MMDAGILGPDGKPAAIPLKSVRIHGDICGLFGELSVEQRYINEGNKDLEIIYTFPLPDKAVISQFCARVGGRTITSEIKEKKEAFELYDRALRKGDSAYLLEKFRPNIFQVSLGRVFPREEVNIKVVYLETISYQDGEVRISIPTLVAPRYIPGKPVKGKKGMGWSDPTNEVPDADFITPPVDSGAAYRVELDLSVEPLMPVDEFASPSHSLNVTAGEDGSTRITLAEGKALLDRDIVIIGRCREEGAATGLNWKDPETGEGYFYLNLIPELGAGYDREAFNYIFLIDISGSMQGAKLLQAKNALQLCLRNMEPGDRFNIVAFESSCHYFSPAGSLPFNQASLDRASAWISNLDSMGGTEIMAPVKFALENSGEGGTVILLFTDGQVSNEQEIINLVSRRIRGNRLFAFGIDTAVNSYFINELSWRGGGLPEFIYPGERIEDKVIRQFSRINSPAVSNITVNWSKMQGVEHYPAGIPAIYDREPVTLVGKYCGKQAGTVTLTGSLKDDHFEVEMDLAGIRTGDKYGFLKKIWGKMKIEHLENSLGEINPRRREALVEELVELSREYGIGSSQTAFVAVQERVNKATGIPETVVVPVAPVAEWEMLHLARPDSRMGPAVLSAPPSEKQAGFQSGHYMMLSDTAMTFPDEGSTAWSPDSHLQEAIRLIAMQQNADGSFPAERDASGPPEASTFENTALGALAMLLAAEDSGIYHRQIEKAVKYLLKEQPQDHPVEFSFFAAALACKFYLEKMRPAKRTAGPAADGKEIFLNKSGPLAATLENPNLPVKGVIEVLFGLLGDRISAVQDVTVKSSVRQLAAAIFKEMLQAG